jgi:peptidoglycan/LPS O-acetylase OafA/YrhL
MKDLRLRQTGNSKWQMENLYNPSANIDIPSKNNFNIIRLFLASFVMLAHLTELTQEKYLHWTNYLPNSYTAINSFFIISGFLVFRSYERTDNVKEFLMRRFLRIYPAYMVVIVFGVLLGAFLTTLSPLIYFSSLETYKYLGYNLIFMNFLQPTLPGVFENNFIHVVNGSLWTLKIEFMFYFSVPMILFVVRYIRRDVVFILLYLISVLYLGSMFLLSKEIGNTLFDSFSKQLPGQLMYFICGAIVYYHFTKLSRIPLWIIIPSVIIYFFSLKYNLYFLFPLCLAGIIFPLAFTKSSFSPGFIAKNDLSYGLYLFHFPVIQWFCARSFFKENELLGFSVFIIVILFISYCSWTLIERKFIRKNN